MQTTACTLFAAAREIGALPKLIHLLTGAQQLHKLAEEARHID